MREKVKYINYESGRNFVFNKDRINDLSFELESFVDEEMNDLDFSDFIYMQEIKTNNTIEGYLDDISLIEKVIDNTSNITDNSRKNRIINLYKGYKYILEGKTINKYNLKDLYSILSKGLLDKYDIEHMGDFYRLGDVFIYYTNNLSVEPDRGVDPLNVEPLMDNYFSFLSFNSDINSNVDYFIKSQIAHLYFVYIHPYFDINGRTSRTVSMWYLLNNDCLPYAIFNRAIENSRGTYYDVIRNSKISGNLTNFIKYMIINTKKELEKEYVFRSIKENINEKLTLTDYNVIISILSMRGLRTLKDFTSFYNKQNDKKKIDDIYNEMILPLMEKDVIVKKRDTLSFYNGSSKNFVFDLNDKYIDVDKSKITRIRLK